jgi:hypothetical protein
VQRVAGLLHGGDRIAQQRGLAGSLMVIVTGGPPVAQPNSVAQIGRCGSPRSSSCTRARRRISRTPATSAAYGWTAIVSKVPRAPLAYIASMNCGGVRPLPAYGRPPATISAPGSIARIAAPTASSMRTYAAGSGPVAQKAWMLGSFQTCQLSIGDGVIAGCDVQKLPPGP